MKRLVLALLLVLVLAWVCLRWWRRRASRSGAGGAEFPYRKASMPPANEMLSTLRNSLPRVRKNSGFDRLIVREKGDHFRSDGAADHYTEELRVRMDPLTSAQSLSVWGVWSNRSLRAHAIKYARDREPRHHYLRRKLEEMTEPVWDTNPILVCYILRRLARKRKAKIFDIRVADAGVGWGGQALGACAADVGCYHAYVPYASLIGRAVAEQIRRALDEHHPPATSSNEFWVREMEMQQAAPRTLYDVIFLSESDLTPLVEPRSVWTMLTPAGSVVLFAGPGERAARRASAALELTRDLPPPKIYGVRTEFGETSRALVWTKLKEKESIHLRNGRSARAANDGVGREDAEVCHWAAHV